MIQIRRILCPTDFSEASRRALEHAVAVASWYEAEITVAGNEGRSEGQRAPDARTAGRGRHHSLKRYERPALTVASTCVLSNP
jgi:nucleotide-binding universal stress UspA family protein